MMPIHALSIIFGVLFALLYTPVVDEYIKTGNLRGTLEFAKRHARENAVLVVLIEGSFIASLIILWVNG